MVFIESAISRVISLTLALSLGDTPIGCSIRLHFGAGEYGHYRSFSVLVLFIGDYDVELSLGECCLVNGQVWPDILGKDGPLFGMSLLFPIFKIA